LKKHTKIYMDAFGYDVTDFIPCEVCNAKAVDIHHIESRGMGGSKDKDIIENLMALCRSCHNRYEGNKSDKAMLRVVHLVKMSQRKK